MKNKHTQIKILPRTSLLSILIALAVVVSACNNDSPTEVEELQLHKDGIITQLFEEVLPDQNGDGSNEVVLLDSLQIHEELHAIDIPNAIPFELPTTAYVTVTFMGDFIGVQDTIYYWYESDRMLGDQIARLSKISLLGKNQATIVLPAAGAEPARNVKGYLFVLDSDNDNEGTGWVTFNSTTVADTFLIDAARNTVCYTQNSAATEITPHENVTSFIVTTQPRHGARDYESYRFLQYGSICMLIDVDTRNVRVVTASGVYQFHDVARQYQVYGFAPNFIESRYQPLLTVKESEP